MEPEAELFRGRWRCGISDALRKFVFLRPYAGLLAKLLGRLQLHDSMRCYDRLAVGLRVRNRYVIRKCVLVHATVTLDDTHLIAVRITGGAEPGRLVETRGFHDQRTILVPMANRVTVPRRIGVRGKQPPIGPNGTPFVLC